MRLVSKVKVSMTIDEEVLQAFKIYCSERGMKISSKVELMMKEKVSGIITR